MPGSLPNDEFVRMTQCTLAQMVRMQSILLLFLAKVQMLGILLYKMFNQDSSGIGVSDPVRVGSLE